MVVVAAVESLQNCRLHLMLMSLIVEDLLMFFSGNIFLSTCYLTKYRRNFEKLDYKYYTLKMTTAAPPIWDIMSVISAMKNI